MATSEFWRFLPISSYLSRNSLVHEGTPRKSGNLGGAGNSKAGVPSGFVPFERRGNAPPPAHVIVRIPPRASARPRTRGAKSAQTPISRQNRAFPATSDQTELRGIPGGGAGRRNAKDRALIGPETAELETTYFMNCPY